MSTTDVAKFPLLGGAIGGAFQESIRGGVPHVALCKECGLRFYYPRSVCPRCLHDRVQLTEHRSPLRVYSFTYVYRVQSKIFEPAAPALMMTVVDGELRMIVEGHGWDLDSPPQIGDSIMLACKMREDGSTVLVGQPQ